MHTLRRHEHREIPPWCHISASGKVCTPSDNDIWIPRDAFRSLDIYWDGLWCRANYFTWDYGCVFRYEGPGLPTDGRQWTEGRYTPPIALEVQIVNLAGQGMLFEELEKIVRRPRLEVAAIMHQHGYNGYACSIHYGLKAELRLSPQEYA
jgi:hypothetical protein